MLMYNLAIPSTIYILPKYFVSVMNQPNYTFNHYTVYTSHSVCKNEYLASQENSSTGIVQFHPCEDFAFVFTAPHNTNKQHLNFLKAFLFITTARCSAEEESTQVK